MKSEGVMNRHMKVRVISHSQRSAMVMAAMLPLLSLLFVVASLVVEGEFTECYP